LVSRRKGIVVRAGVIFVAVGVLLGAFASLGFGFLGDRENETTAELAIEPSVPGGPQGVGFLVYGGGRLSGQIVVWGLEENAAHAVHFHGPDSSCGTEADAVASHPDLVAGADGVAVVRVEVATSTNVLRPGFYYNVHAQPSTAPDNPEIACGDVAP
jgi:hypothetical protein